MENKKVDLSIIIPFAGEFPQVLFTIQSIAESLKNKINFEIIAIDNFCLELEVQWAQARLKAATIINSLALGNKKETTPKDISEITDVVACMINGNKAGEAIKASAGGNPWLKYMAFDEKLSHWECKRLACEIAEADTLLFIDAHCVPSDGIADMFSQYFGRYDKLASFHMPLTYKILEWRRLVYKMVIENNFYGYSFTSFPGENNVKSDPVEVPCMSTCGMMISKSIYNRVGGWPKYFGAYGGGENFMNYALAVTGHTKYIYPNVTLHHHGERRDYHYQYDTTLWNRLVAHYLFGGKEKLFALHSVSKGKPIVLNKMVSDILANASYQKQRSIIKDNSVVTLDEFQKHWEKISRSK